MKAASNNPPAVAANRNSRGIGNGNTDWLRAKTAMALIKGKVD